MAWASTDVIPGNISIPLVYSIQNGFVNDQTAILTASSSNGTPFDFSAATNVFAVCDPAPDDSIGSHITSLSASIVSSLVGKLQFKIAKASMSNLIGLGTRSFKVTITATDGTTNLIVGTGSVNINVTT